MSWGLCSDGQQGAAEDCPLLLTALGERPQRCLSHQRLNQGWEGDKEAGKGHHLSTRSYGLQTSRPPLSCPFSTCSSPLATTFLGTAGISCHRWSPSRPDA